MKCPLDDSVLVMSERSGIEIDFCPQCRGVWLDRGELDKIIERSESQPSRDSRPAASYQGDDYRDQRGGVGGLGGFGGFGGDRDDDRNRRRKGGWLGELFD